MTSVGSFKPRTSDGVRTLLDGNRTTTTAGKAHTATGHDVKQPEIRIVLKHRVDDERVSNESHTHLTNTLITM